MSRSSQPVASPFALTASAFAGFRHCKARRPLTALAHRKRFAFRQFKCSSNVRLRRLVSLRSVTRMPPSSPTFAAGSMGFHSLSSSLRLVSIALELEASLLASMTACVSLPVAVALRCRGSKPCVRRSIGAMTCLPKLQQMVLRRVSVFSGDFTLRAADFVISDDPDVRNHIVDHVAELVTKSLILAEMGDAEPRLRLLETTRAYALAKLIESGEFEAIAPRYAAYVKDFGRPPLRAMKA